MVTHILLAYTRSPNTEIATQTIVKLPPPPPLDNCEQYQLQVRYTAFSYMITTPVFIHPLTTFFTSATETTLYRGSTPRFIIISLQSLVINSEIIFKIHIYQFKVCVLIPIFHFHITNDLLNLSAKLNDHSSNPEILKSLQIFRHVFRALSPHSQNYRLYCLLLRLLQLL